MQTCALGSAIFGATAGGHFDLPGRAGKDDRIEGNDLCANSGKCEDVRPAVRYLSRTP